MLPPRPMLTIKNRVHRDLAPAQKGTWRFSCAAMLVFLMALIAGCAPPGPRALLEGKRLLDEGKYPQAIDRLKAATSLLGGTNALSWNYLGLAYHHANQAPEAERAYLKALALDRDLSEAHYNLGCLWLGQNRLEAAKAEFTACTLRRPNRIEGFLKLGAVQLRARDAIAAEKSFGDALRLDAHNPEAFNGLGLAKLQRGRPNEAAQCFDDALKQQPEYGPALLNLAIVSQQYLKDRQLAVEKYREYLALKPPPEDTEAIKATVQQLEQELNPSARRSATNEVAQPAPKLNPPKPIVTNVARVTNIAKSEPAPASAVKPAPALSAKLEPIAHMPKPPPTNVTAPPTNVEVVKLPAEPAFKRAQDVSPAPAPRPATAAEPLVTTSTVPADVSKTKSARRSLIQRVNPLNLFHSTEQLPKRPPPMALADGTSGGAPAQRTALGPPPASSALTPDTAELAKRYAYRSPPRPEPGNRAEAERAFAQGAQAYAEDRLPEAVQAYRLAVQLDPSYFDAQYNLGLAATKAGNLSAALVAYEDALVIQPTSLNARYNFALVLRQASYTADAVKQLEKVLAIYPNETRAHLALANIYAQQLHEPAKARRHYLKVLEEDPHHPAAGEIRFWLAANPA